MMLELYWIGVLQKQILTFWFSSHFLSSCYLRPNGIFLGKNYSIRNKRYINCGWSQFSECMCFSNTFLKKRNHMNCIIGISEILFLPIQYTRRDVSFLTVGETLELRLDFSSLVFLKIERMTLT